MSPAPRKEFIDAVNSMTGSRSTYDVFTDFLELSFCSLKKRTVRGEEAENLEYRYMKAVGKYSKEEATKMGHMLGMVSLGVFQTDFLGDIFCSLDMGNSRMGQFFTPFHLSVACAAVTLSNIREEARRKGLVTVSDPAVGAGGMLLAAAKHTHDCGVDPCRFLWVGGQDVSAVAYKMCYVQCAVRGLCGTIKLGDTLANEVAEVSVLPMTYHLLTVDADRVTPVLRKAGFIS